MTEKPKYVAGYTTDKGLLLDLDRTTFQETLTIAKRLLKQHKLEGYLITQSSPLSHHIIFNKPLRWKTVISHLFKLVWRYHYYEHQRLSGLTHWAILQVCKKSCTLRVSGKNQKASPRLLMHYGKQDKIIKDYLEVYYTFNTKKLHNKAYEIFK